MLGRWQRTFSVLARAMGVGFELEEMGFQTGLKCQNQLVLQWVKEFKLVFKLVSDCLKMLMGLDCLLPMVGVGQYYKEDQTVYYLASSCQLDLQSQSNQTALQCFLTFLLLTHFLPPPQQGLVLFHLYLDVFACTFKLFFRSSEYLLLRTFLKVCCIWY